MADLPARVALVTGGGTGIGRATALRLAAKGYRVVVSGRREGPLRETMTEVPELISYAQMDLADVATHQMAISTVIDRHGRLDLLVNNASIAVCKPFLEHTIEDITSIAQTNFVGTLSLTQQALPHLISSRGNIVTVSATGGTWSGLPYKNTPAYGAIKAALNQLSRLLAVEFGPLGVRVNVVSPGTVETELLVETLGSEEVALRFFEGSARETPLGRIGKPDDIAKVICFLASEDAGWLTGQIVTASGGRHMT